MSNTNNEKQSKKNQFWCKYCSKFISGNSYKYKAHLYLHKLVNPRYQCIHCLKGFFRRDMYERHITSHGGVKVTKNVKTYVCDYCDRGYLDKRNLITHLRIHDDSVLLNLKRFECKACGADFSENRVLLNHIRRYHFSHTTNDEPLHVKRSVNESWVENVVQTDKYVQITKVNNNVLSIRKCGKIKIETKPDLKKTIDKQDNYDLRMNKYTSYSKAICDYCNKVMLKKSIRNHIRERHTNVRKFKCSECKQSFSRHYQMMDHVCGKYKQRRRYSKSVSKIKLKEE